MSSDLFRPNASTASETSTPPSIFSGTYASNLFGSSNQSFTSSAINQGTRDTPVAPYLVEQSGESCQDHFQNIASHHNYSHFSPDELRLEDYRHGRSGEKVKQAAQSSQDSFPQPAGESSDPTTLISTRRDRQHLLLLCGATIDIRVGTAVCACAESAACVCSNAWSLPKALISRYSPFLKAACQRDFQEKQENCITLPEDEPEVFALFVEWMYYGSYTTPCASIPSVDPNLEAKCWILGDKLLCVDFKNIAMKRIYQSQCGVVAGRKVSTDDMEYILDNTGITSNLRLFYIDYMTANWANDERLKGTTQQWDELLLDHADARLALLETFRNARRVQPVIKNEIRYLETDETVLRAFGKITIKE